jgi:DNA mismatch repair protein MutL
MIPGDSFPLYVLFIDLDPTQVDVNVHPTKQEIKFEDEKIIYAFVQAAVKHALAQFSVTPTLDFELDSSIQQLPSIQQPFTEEKRSAATAGSIYKGFTEKHQAHFIEPTKKSELKHWRDFFESPRSTVDSQQAAAGSQQSAVGGQQLGSGSESSEPFTTHHSPFTILTQLHNQFILAQIDNGFILINQQAAHERVLYDQLNIAMNGNAIATQRSLFPVTLNLSPADAASLEELMSDLHLLGYMIEPFGKNSFVIQGTPADIEQGNEKSIVEKLLEQYKHFSSDLKFSKREKLVRSVAKQQSIKPGRRLTEKEMQALINDLFACKQFNSTPDGKPTYLDFKMEQLEKMFKG